MLLAMGIAAQSQAESTSSNAAVQTYEAARDAWKRNPADPNAAWQFARACFDLAEVNEKRRAAVAEEGIDACRQSLRQHPKVGGAHYYMALNLGQLARTKTLGALKLVAEMEETLKKAIELDPTFDYAGPHRSLGLLYRDAPGWPASIGSRSNAKSHLRKAVALAPDYPDNHISLIESYLQWSEIKNARAAVSSAEPKLREARQKLAGDRWKESWRDWDKRWERIRRKTETDLRSPRGQSQGAATNSSSINTAHESGL